MNSAATEEATAPQTLNVDELLDLKTDNDWDTGSTFSSGWDTTFLSIPFLSRRGDMLTRRFWIFGWEAGSFHRIVQGGPLVEGPHAYMQEKATVLTAHQQAPVREVPVKDGDHLTIRGTEYIITVVNGNPLLVLAQ